MIIVVEGVDGSGKNTVADGVARHFEALRLDFPYEEGSPTGKLIREFLAGWWKAVAMYPRRGSELQAMTSANERNALVLQALFTTNKYEVQGLLQRHAGIHNPRHLVLARYIPSVFVYSGMDGLDRVWLEAIHAGLPAADVNILVDVDAEIAMQRIGSRGEQREIYEKQEKVEGAVSAYRALWHEKQSAWVDPTRTPVGWYTVDGSFAIEEVILLATECVRWELSDEC